MTTVNQEIITSKTTWVRGVALRFDATQTHVLIQIGTVLMDQQPYTYVGEDEFERFVQTYKQALARGHHTFTIPRARTNATDEFIYPLTSGDFDVLSGYANLEWDETSLTDTQLAEGRFFLRHTNETLGTLLVDHSYTVIRFSASSTPRVQRHQSLAEVIQSSQQSDWLMDYLNGRLLIFDEARAVELSKAQWNPLWVAALNENSAYPTLPHPLTPELKEVYFSKQDLKKRFGFNVEIAKVVPSGYTIKQSKTGEVKVVHYYHSDLVPQSFLCKCGKHTQQTGPLSARLCWDCLATYQESCIERSVRKLEQQLTSVSTTPSLEPVFVVIHTNQGRGPAGMIREIINLCVMDQQQTVLFQSLIRPTGTLSKNNRQRGYQTDVLKTAPTFESVHEAFAQAIRGKLVVFFNAEERRSIYHACCLQKGIEPEAIPHWTCLKDILIPISYGVKRLHKLREMQGGPVLKELRGLQLECQALGITVPGQPSIQKDAAMMHQIYHTLGRKKLTSTWAA